MHILQLYHGWNGNKILKKCARMRGKCKFVSEMHHQISKPVSLLQCEQNFFVDSVLEQEGFLVEKLADRPTGERDKYCHCLLLLSYLIEPSSLTRTRRGNACARIINSMPEIV